MDLHLDLIAPNAAILNQTAAEIPVQSIPTDEIQAIIDEMFRIAHGEQGDTARKTLVGLAAPQVGVSKRIILVGVDADGTGKNPQLTAYINPIITDQSADTDDNREGCYSTGSVCGIVARSKQITLTAYDRTGAKITETHQGFPARVFQHEIDHLDGIRFPDRITDDQKLHWVEPSEFGNYREQWATWPIHCSRHTWETMRRPE